MGIKIRYNILPLIFLVKEKRKYKTVILWNDNLLLEKEEEIKIEQTHHEKKTYPLWGEANANQCYTI